VTPRHREGLQYQVLTTGSHYNSVELSSYDYFLFKSHLFLRIHRTASALVENGHVNNVQFVQWMQDAAVRHYESLGGILLTQALETTWVVRSHNIEYLRPAFALFRHANLRIFQFYERS
jgi:hypothetical protein